MDKYYFKVPNNVFTMGLSKYELLVVFYICRCQNNKQFAFPSYETIARNCGISRMKAISTIKNLIKKGLLEKQVRPDSFRKYHVNLYHLKMDKLYSAQNTPGSTHHVPKEELHIKELNNKEIRDGTYQNVNS